MLAIVAHPDCLLHDPGPLHPDRPERLDAINNQVISSGLEFVIRFYDAPEATRVEVYAAHDAAYVDGVFAQAADSKTVRLDPDTAVGPGALTAALRAAGAAAKAVDLVMAGEACPEFRAAIAEHWLPALELFRPEFVFLSAGVDGHILDEMSDFSLAEADYAWLTEQVMSVARRHARGRVVSVLEGGYDCGSLGRSVVAHLKAML